MMASESLMRSRCGASQQTASRSSYGNTNSCLSANSPLTMITLAKPGGSRSENGGSR